MNEEDQSARFARTPKLHGDLSAGELAYERLLQEQHERELRTQRILRVLGWIAAYLAGAIAGPIILINIAFRNADKGGDSGSPAGILLAFVIVGFGGLVAGLLFVGFIQLGTFVTHTLLNRKRVRNGDPAER